MQKPNCRCLAHQSNMAAHVFSYDGGGTLKVPDWHKILPGNYQLESPLTLVLCFFFFLLQKIKFWKSAPCYITKGTTMPPRSVTTHACRAALLGVQDGNQEDVGPLKVSQQVCLLPLLDRQGSAAVFVPPTGIRQQNMTWLMLLWTFWDSVCACVYLQRADLVEFWDRASVTELSLEILFLWKSLTLKHRHRHCSSNCCCHHWWFFSVVVCFTAMQGKAALFIWPVSYTRQLHVLYMISSTF